MFLLWLPLLTLSNLWSVATSSENLNHGHHLAAASESHLYHFVFPGKLRKVAIMLFTQIKLIAMLPSLLRLLWVEKLICAVCAVTDFSLSDCSVLVEKKSGVGKRVWTMTLMPLCHNSVSPLMSKSWKIDSSHCSWAGNISMWCVTSPMVISKLDPTNDWNCQTRWVSVYLFVWKLVGFAQSKR